MKRLFTQKRVMNQGMETAIYVGDIRVVYPAYKMVRSFLAVDRTSGVAKNNILIRKQLQDAEFCIYYYDRGMPVMCKPAFDF
jgi:hypothetical protein